MLDETFEVQFPWPKEKAMGSDNADVVGVVVSSLALHRGDPGSIPGFGIQAVQIHA